MPDISDDTIRIRGRDHTIAFIADSQDGRLVIRQEPDGKKSKVVVLEQWLRNRHMKPNLHHEDLCI